MKSLAALLLPALAFGQAEPLLPLDDALALASRGNTSILRARSQSAQARDDASQADGAIWPSVSLLSDISRQGPTFSGDPRDPHVNPAAKALVNDLWANTLSARWVIFDGLATPSNRASRRSLADAASARQAGQELSIPALVSTTYHDVTRQQILLESVSQELAVSDERLSVARSRLDVGTFSLLDVQQAELDANADSSALLRQKLTLSQARRQLNWLMGRDPEVPFRADDSIPLGTLPPREELLREARDRSPVLAEARARLAAAESDDHGSMAAFLPTFSLYTNYVLLGQIHDDHPPANASWQGWQYGAQLAVPIFDGGSSLARRRGLSETLNQARISVQELELSLSRDLAQAYAAADQALVNERLESRNAALATNTLELARGRFLSGSLSGIDLRRIQESGLLALGRAVSARFDARAAQIQLFVLAGRPLR